MQNVFYSTRISIVFSLIVFLSKHLFEIIILKKPCFFIAYFSKVFSIYFLFTTKLIACLCVNIMNYSSELFQNN